MIKQLNRRIFLKGLGGAAVAAPFLSSLWERSAKAQSAPTTTKAVIVMFTHYGCITNKFFPDMLSGALTSDALTATSLAPLASHASKILIPRGIRTMNEWTANNTGPGKGRGQGNDSHTQIVGTAFTCQPVTPNSNDPFSFAAATKFNAMPIGPSLDHVMAQQLSPQGTPIFMNVSGQSKESPGSAISYSSAGTIFTAQSATQQYSALTGLFQTGMPVNADTYAVASGKAIQDVVKDDLNRLLNMNMSQDDKNKLQAWLALLSDVQTAVSAMCGQTLATSLGANNKIGAKGASDDVVTHQINSTMDNWDLYSAVAALTAACNANPIIFLKGANNFVYTGLSINEESHALSHRLSDASMSGACVSDAVTNLMKLDTYYAQKFANLLGYLDGIPGTGGTVLDNSVAIWMNEMSDGNAHNLNNAPIIQAGSAGGYFKTGQVINLDTKTLTMENHLGNSLSQCYNGNTTMANGISQGTGTDASIANMPVNKYFCNIMNAMGMKADANGFPAKGGPASEVTHYGYSDNTVDFTGGQGAETPVFQSPGEFAELKA